jgi:transposase
MHQQDKLLVGVDVGSARHKVMIARSGLRDAETFSIEHTGQGLRELFARVRNRRRQQEPVWVILEGKGGWARPIDELILQAGYHLISITNLQMARFRQTFAELGKTDSLDVANALRALDLWLRDKQASKLCREVHPVAAANRHLKELARHRSSLLQEKTRIANRLTGKLQAVLPGLIQITGSLLNVWFLNLLSSRKELSRLKGMRVASLLKIEGIGSRRLQLIRQWQQQAVVGRDVEVLGYWIRQDVDRLLQLRRQLKQLQAQIEQLGQSSRLYQLLVTIPGFGWVSCCQLAGEIGRIDRFAKESSLAVYLGCAPLPHQSGKNKHGTRRPRLINQRARNALCQAVGRHRLLVAQSKAYYLKKSKDYGGRYPKAIRALARNLVRIIWSMATHDRPYEIRKAA